MEQNNRNRLKRMLAGIAVALLCLHLVSMALQQRSTNLSSDTLPTLAAVDNTRGSDMSIAAQAVCTVTVRAQMLNQRSGPGESYEVIGGANRGQVFTIVGWNENKQWVQVEMVTGTAWMAARYTTPSRNCNSVFGNTTNLAVNTAVAVVAATPIPQRTQQTEHTTASIVTTAGLSSVFTPEVLYWSDEIAAWAEIYALDANLIATVIQIESCGNASIHSSAGAQGLFQVMPFHFAAGENMLDVETNARRGLTYLQGALKLAKGEVGLALVGYNGGYGAINGNWAAETQRYYYWGNGIYEEATSGMTTSPTLQEWLAAGGASLCTKASQSQQSGL